MKFTGISAIIIYIVFFQSVLTFKVYSNEKKLFDVPSIIKGILALKNPKTKLCPSHIGHPGYENLAFLYDKAVDALILKVAGYQKEAEEIIDYFNSRLNIPIKVVERMIDTNGVYGTIKLFESISPSKTKARAFVNAIDITSLKAQGIAQLEFYTTPGPLSFLIFSMLAVNREKYQDNALALGEVLLEMQDDGGGIRDGDRAPDRVHTEPHMDGYAAFVMLYEIEGNGKWKLAADKAYEWFEKNVYHPQEGIIDQGVWNKTKSTIFATDVYSWTMAGPAGDNMPTDVLKKLTMTMLSQCLVKIKLSLPDNTIRTVILCDFSNPEDPRVETVRGGFHPMGSVEWTGGVILAIQKNAVRLWNSRDYDDALFYKALAEVLLGETMKCFYFLDELQGKISFYATGQGIEVAPFGSIESKIVNGWKTPYFYARSKRGEELVRGGSPIAAWPLLPYLGLNPFILNDEYHDIYNQIPITKKDIADATSLINNLAENRTFIETVPSEAPDGSVQIIEPKIFNKKMWEAFNNGILAKECGNRKEAERYFREAIGWAYSVVDNPTWRELAKRDNMQKKKEYGGIIFYPWDTTFKDNEHPLHYAILRYPLLNEVGVAMWGLAASYNELGNYKEVKYWVERIIDEVPLHQIPDTVVDTDNNKSELIKGYWNALVSWEFNTARSVRDEQMGGVYKKVLEEKGISNARPRYVELAGKVGEKGNIYFFDTARKK